MRVYQLRTKELRRRFGHLHARYDDYEGERQEKESLSPSIAPARLRRTQRAPNKPRCTNAERNPDDAHASMS